MFLVFISDFARNGRRSIADMFIHNGRVFIPGVTIAWVAIAIGVFYSPMIVGEELYGLAKAFSAYWNRTSFGDHWYSDLWFAFGTMAYQFFHADPAHLARNVTALLLAGWFVERMFVETGLGRLRYVALCLASSVIGGTAADIWNMAQLFNLTLAIGMSATAFGVFGAFVGGNVRVPLIVKIIACWVVFVFVEDSLESVIWHNRPSDAASEVAHVAVFAAGLAAGLAARRAGVAKRAPVGLPLQGEVENSRSSSAELA